VKSLRLQRRLLEEKRRQVGLAIQAIEEVEAELKTAARTAPNFSALKKIIEIMERQTNMEWTKKYYSDEAQVKIAEKAKTFTPEMQAQVTQQWNELVRDIETAIRNNEDPAGVNTRSLGERWAGIVRGFTGGNPEIQKGLNKLYADQANWPSNFQKPFSDEVYGYMKKVMAAHGISCN